MRPVYRYEFNNGETINIMSVDCKAKKNDIRGIVLFTYGKSTKTIARALRETSRGVPYFVPRPGCKIFLKTCEEIHYVEVQSA